LDSHTRDSKRPPLYRKDWSLPYQREQRVSFQVLFQMSVEWRLVLDYYPEFVGAEMYRLSRVPRVKEPIKYESA
jgi:hypothetical protein